MIIKSPGSSSASGSGVPLPALASLLGSRFRLGCCPRRRRAAPAKARESGGNGLSGGDGRAEGRGGLLGGL